MEYEAAYVELDQQSRIDQLEFDLAMEKIDTKYLRRHIAIDAYYCPRQTIAIAVASAFAGVAVGTIIGLLLAAM